MSPRIQARDSRGVLRCSLKLEMLGGDLDAESVAQLLARIIGEYEPGPSALMLAAIESGQM
ncbi:hypothetical protein [Kineosporia sp. NBRC 101731]|uniref:hypothetical protein n=1 Tax=Kineosporia sp. NBRC 101731 TaxID=3032199 RepID=UPI0025545A14|nr:hypothetical protein [Kineosporia sp. NBRC 101731]